MLVFNHRLLLICALFFGSFNFSTTQAYGKNCVYVSWDMDTKTVNEDIAPELMQDCPYMSLDRYFIERFDHNLHNFCRSSCNIDRKSFEQGFKENPYRTNLLKRFLSQKTFKLSFPELLKLSKENPKQFFRFYAANIYEKGIFPEELIKEAAQTSAACNKDPNCVRFWFDMHTKTRSLRHTYRIFWLNDISRTFLMPPKLDFMSMFAGLDPKKKTQSCARCLECKTLTSKKIQSVLNANQKKSAAAQKAILARMQVALCPTHKKISRIGLGALGSFDISHQKQKDLPSLATNPSLYLWSPIEQESSTATLIEGFKEEMRLFVGDSQTEHEEVGLRLKRTQTFAGDVFFERLLAKPCSNVDQLEARKAVVKKLMENDELYKKLRTALDRVQTVQRAITDFIYDQADEAMRNTNLLLYPQGSNLLKMFEQLAEGTKSSGIKNLIERINRHPLGITAAPIVKALALAVAIGVPLHWITKGLDKQFAKDGQGDFKPQNLAPFIGGDTKEAWSRLWDAFKNMLEKRGKATANSAALGFADNYYTDKINLKQLCINALLILVLGPLAIPLFVPKIAMHAYGIGVTGMAVWESVTTGRHTKEYLKKSFSAVGGYKNICRILKALKTFALATKALNKIMLENPDIAQVLNLSDDLKHFVNGVRPHEKEMLHDMLAYNNDSYFDLGSNFLPAFSNNLSRIRKLFSVRWSLTRPLEAIGQIDAFVSAATLMREHQDKKNGYCFAEFDRSGKVGFVLEDFWNPYYSSEAVVTNSLGFGLDGTDSQNMLLGGPNANGKSTVLRGMPINLLLSQVFGIAAAKRCVTSTYDIFASCMSVKDAPARDLSLFKNQCRIMDDLKHIMQDAKEAGKKMLLVVDEIYSGSGEVSSVPLAIPYLKCIAENSLSTALITTHFNKLNQEGALLTNNKFKNYRVVIMRDENGKMIKTFKVEPGIPDNIKDAVGIDVAAEAGVDPKDIAAAQKLQLELFGKMK